MAAPPADPCTPRHPGRGLWSSHNYLEFFVRTAARVYALQRAGALDPRTTLVTGQPPGERPPGFVPTVLRALTPHDVVSFSTVGGRLGGLRVDGWLIGWEDGWSRCCLGL